MQTFVALMYSIVLGRGRRLVMTDLRDMALGLGLTAPRTVMATGNLIFEADERSAVGLDARLETAFVRNFGKHIDIITNSAADWQKLMTNNPFAVEAEVDPASVVVRVMRHPYAPDIVDKLTPYINDERIAVVNGNLWIHFARKPELSKLFSALSTKRLAAVGTLRNWNTVRRIGEIL